MKQKVIAHFRRVDPKLFAAIDADIRLFSVNTKEKTPAQLFQSLCRSIVGQQLSGKVARSIYDRFEGLFPRKYVSPKKLIEFSEHDLRGVGMSYAKARALLDHAEKVLEKKITYHNIHKKTDDEVKDMLLQVKGVGPWTCEMFLMFSLAREDIFSPKDLGLQKGIQKIYSLKRKPTEQEAERIANKWSPYRTYAAMILWHTVDT